MIPTDEYPKNFGEVFHEELREIQQRRSQTQNCGLDAPLPRDLVGLALSGGGIRSATFSLGLLQGLKKLNLLPIFDYLSTVSGGGFAGGWWSAWLSRDVRDPYDMFPPGERAEAQRSDDYSIAGDDQAKSSKVVESSINADKDPIHHLRLFSNYLTPRRGALSTDTWRAITSIARNLALTWLVLLPILVATVLVGQLYFVVFSGGDFPHQNTLMVSQGTTLEDVRRDFQESFFHAPSDTGNTLRKRALVAVIPVAILASITIFFAFCWVLGIQSGPKLLRLVNAIIGVTFMVIIVVIFKPHRSDLFIASTFAVFLIALITVVFTVFRVPSTLFRLFLALTRFIKKSLKGSDGLKETGAQVRAHVTAKLKRAAKVDRRAEDQWRREVYLNAMTRWTARWFVILAVTTAILLVSGFGHEVVEYICCYTTPSGTPLKMGLHYAVKSVSLSGLFAAIAGVIYTWAKAAPTGGGDKSDAGNPSATSRLIFAITPPLVIVVLAITTAWLAHALVWFIISNHGAGMTGLTSTTRVGVFLSFFLVVVEIEWKRIRQWIGIVTVGAALAFVGLIVYPLIPKDQSGITPLPAWSLAVFAIVAMLALFKPLVSRMTHSNVFYDKQKGYKIKFFVLTPLMLIGLIVAGLLFAGGVSRFVGSSVSRTPDAAVLEGAVKGLARCGVVYSVLILIQIVGRYSNRRSYWLVTSLFFVLTMLATMSYFEKDARIIPIRAVMLLTTTALAWVVTLGWMVDPNALSLHSFYKGRLVRAYLGASNTRRAGKQKEVTESVEGDDVLLSDLQNCRQGAPYHLINTTLNLVGGRDLATAQRSSAMFVLSKHFCGSVRTGYRRTSKYMDGEFSLGAALSVSGAAASPNMGSVKTTASLAMLMTLLNVRLGYWAPTPNKGRWDSAQARLWPYYVLREFLSETNDLSTYCYLTDGGHFDNTGLYSLVERGCRCIVIADCSADPTPCFADLGNAIRRCRIDFDAEIDLDVAPFIRGKSEAFAKQHYVVGKIRYSEKHFEGLGWNKASDDDRTGFVIYLKPALLEHDTGLTVDVRQYGIQNTNFPQQSTADQWFDESQFESYRKLGHHTATIAFSALDEVQEMKEYKTALEAKNQGQTPSDEEQRLIEAKLARDRIKNQQFSSRDVLNLFDLLYAKRPI